MVIQFRLFAPLLLSLLAAGAPLAAEPPVDAALGGGPIELDLAGALARARAHAPEVAAAAARADAARARADQAAAERRPRVRLSEIWARTDSPAEAFAYQLNQERFSFPAFAASDPNDPRPINAGITRFELEMPVLTGGELPARIAQGRLAADAARASAQSSGDGAALAAAEAYVGLVRVREAVAVLERARETVARHVEVARAYEAQGMLVRSEVLRAEVELARLDDQLAEARGGERVAEANLAFRIGAPQGSAFVLAPLPATAPGDGDELAPWLAAAAERPDLAAARKLLAAADLEAVARRAASRPRLGLVVRRDYTDDRPFGTHGDATSAMAVATLELWDGGRRKSAVAAARADAEAGRRDVERFEEGVRLEVRQAFEEAASARSRVATAERARAAAEEAARIVRERFGAGVAKTIDVLDAATAAREAEMRAVVARADLEVARLRLATRAGRAPESAFGAAAPTAETNEVDAMRSDAEEGR